MFPSRSLRVRSVFRAQSAIWVKTRIFLGLLLLATTAFAQDTDEEEPLITDRPDFTESADSVDKGRVQLESGVTFTAIEDFEAWSLGEVLIRIGLSRSIELRVGVNSYLDIQEGDEGVSGLENSSIGAKFEIAEGGPGKALGGATMAILAGTSLATGTGELRDVHLFPSAVWALSWELSDTVGLGSNVGVSFASVGEKEFFEGLASVAAGIGLSPSWGTFVELFGIFPLDSAGGPERGYFDAGVTYLIHNDLQLDFRVGQGFNGDSPDYFVGAGFAARF